MGHRLSRGGEANMSLMKQKIRRFGLATLLVMAMGVPAVTAQEEEKKTGWSDSADLSLVATGGNSESTTFGFKNTLEREWEQAKFTLIAGGVRANSATGGRIAIGPDDMTFIVVDPEKKTSAENFFLRGKYDKNMSKRFFWYTSAGWNRNRPAGINNRYVVAGGVGNAWKDEEGLLFRTEYALTYTDQEDLLEDPTTKDTFLGFRFSWEYKNKLGKNSEYVNNLIVDENLDETKDFRVNMFQSIAVNINERLALKVGLVLLYDNLPSLEGIERFDPGDLVNPVSVVLVELDELDTIFTTSLVVKF